MLDYFLPFVEYLEDDNGKVLKDTKGICSRDGFEKVEIKIEQEKVGLLLGRSGINIKRIELDTKTVCAVNQGNRSEGYSILKIEGKPEGIAEARERVDELLAVEVILPKGQSKTILQEIEEKDAIEEAKRLGLSPPTPPVKESSAEQPVEVTPYGIGWPSKAEHTRVWGSNGPPPEAIASLIGKGSMPMGMP